MIDFNVAMDIETTGLNPWEDRVVTVALVGNKGDTIEVFDEPEDEQKVLGAIEQYMRHTRIEQIVTWNGSEFDIPFLAVRFVLNGEDLPPFIRPTGETGKYGKPRYDGVWYGAQFLDIAYKFEEEAKSAGVRWSLKPFAEYKQLGRGIEYDFSEPFTVLDLDKGQRELYCTSDAQLVMGLFLGLQDSPEGRAVTLEGGLTIL